MLLEVASTAPIPQTRSQVDANAPAIVVESLDAIEIVHVFGELDFVAAPAFEDALVRSMRLGKTLVANLSETRYIDAATIGVLVRARKAAGERFAVRATRGSFPRRILELCALGELLDPLSE